MIGSWVARAIGPDSALRYVTKFHLVESQIADRQITRCGRQLHPRDGYALVWDEYPQPGSRCLYCDRGR